MPSIRFVFPQLSDGSLCVRSAQLWDAKSETSETLQVVHNRDTTRVC